MKQEYEEIVSNDIYLQLDCPDLALARHMTFKDLSEEDFLKTINDDNECQRQLSSFMTSTTSSIAPNRQNKTKISRTSLFGKSGNKKKHLPNIPNVQDI